MQRSAETVRQLREITGAGMMDCKKALEETNYNSMEDAIEYLRKKKGMTAAKKADRIAAEGLVDAYIHGDGRIGSLVEVNIETDFAARSEKFKTFVRDIAMQIVASKPQYVRREEVPESVVLKEKEILSAQIAESGKPANIVEKIVVGRMDKFYQEICLMEQPFIKNPDITIKQLLEDIIGDIGENITIRRFVRFERGEGLEKRQDDFASEVMKQVQAGS